MAQHSKKDLIADAALPLFFELGIKGTSVDMVVKNAGVSKPTVYNHFPDKANLLLHTLMLWLSRQPSPAFAAHAEKSLMTEIQKTWLNPEALRLYGLFMGEGFRVPQAKATFTQRYDLMWRNELTHWARHYNLDGTLLSHQVNTVIVTSLL